LNEIQTDMTKVQKIPKTLLFFTGVFFVNDEISIFMCFSC